MPDSDYVFEKGEPIFVGSHGDTEYVFESGVPVSNTGDESSFVFESGIGLGGFPGLENFENFPDDKSLYQGDTGLFGSQTNVVTEGDRAGSFQHRDSQDFVWTTEKGGFEEDVLYRADIYTTSGMNIGVTGFQDSNGNGYSFSIASNQDELEINKIDPSSGGANAIAQTFQDYNDNTWYTIEFGRVNGTLILEAVNTGDRITVNDTQYSGDAFGFKSGGIGSGEAYMDNVRTYEENP